MYRYIINRILLVFPTLFGAATLVFILMRLIPGDICLVRLGSGGTSFTESALAGCHAEIGITRFSRPVPVEQPRTSDDLEPRTHERGGWTRPCPGAAWLPAGFRQAARSRRGRQTPRIGTSTWHGRVSTTSPSSDVV